jgi:hypothetical protein
VRVGILFHVGVNATLVNLTKRNCNFLPAAAGRQWCVRARLRSRLKTARVTLFLAKQFIL